MHSDVPKPTDLLVANAASYSEMLISHVHCDSNRLHNRDALGARHTVIYHIIDCFLELFYTLNQKLILLLLLVDFVLIDYSRIEF